MIQKINTQNILSETAVATTNQRIILTNTNTPDALQLIEESLPQPAAGEVRVRVLTSGVAFADVMCRQGSYPTMPKLPFTPGYDFVGVIDLLGPSVDTLSIGQTVGALLPKFGANANYVCVPANLLVPIPVDIDPAAGVTVILNYLTAYRLLTVSTNAQAGERILVHSAAGGVGTAVLQIGKILGLEMYGTASAGKLDLVSSLGATAIDYKHEDFAARMRASAPDGIDIVIDPVGGKTMQQSYKLLRSGGRLVSYGFMSTLGGGLLAILPNFLRLGWYGIWPDGKKGFFYGDTPTHVTKENGWYRKTLTLLFDWLCDGRIVPIIGAKLPLAETAKAQHMLETGAVQGKIVLIHAA